MNKNTSSIARRLNLSWTLKRFFNYLVWDGAVIVLLCLGWYYLSEKYHLNPADYPEEAIILCYVAIAALGIQLFDVLWLLVFGVFGIRRKLKPLDDVARRAEELSRIAFDESKYANLESAIENLNPEAQEAVVFTGNKDLEGVEIAINNLLSRMRDSYRQQSRFVSDASHELRTPIAVIQGYANMLDRWGKSDEQVLDESIEAIRHESEHIDRKSVV